LVLLSFVVFWRLNPKLSCYLFARLVARWRDTGAARRFKTTAAVLVRRAGAVRETPEIDPQR
jgi:hypothetical protein